MAVEISLVLFVLLFVISQNMQLKLSEIYFSQNEINNHFDKKSIHRNTNLGDTLDDLVEGRCRISDVPTINVMNINGRWVTADNRRLWVFRNLEKLGRCSTITVNETFYIDSRKLNYTNGGRTVRFYSGKYANGNWHQHVESIDPGEPITTKLKATSRFPKIPEDPTGSSTTYIAQEEIEDNKRNAKPSQNMQLKPSEIYFSQSEINNHFDKRSIHRNTNLGDTLDALVEGRCRISSIPTISVMKRNGRWVTADNRRLWVFRHLEKLGKCSTITVSITGFIDPRKLNSTNGGRTVRFYSGRYASGIWYQRVSSIDPGEPTTTDSQTGLDNTTNSTFSRPTFSSYTSRPVPSNLGSYTTEYHSRPPTTSNVFSSSQSESLSSILRSLDLTNTDMLSELNPCDIRYTKESININTFFRNLEFSLRYGLKNQNDVDPVTVYKAFGKHWVTDGNKRVWSFKQAQSSKTTLKIKADVNDDKEEFLDEIRTERPWLSLFDILQSGESIQIV